ncbi:MAG: sulfatase-like hydrolase/transferase [Phycisphaerae bacterium]|nr:sulfatase-like hydrolase/transferase [Phycisphaerae bacterium]
MSEEILQAPRLLGDSNPTPAVGASRDAAGRAEVSRLGRAWSTLAWSVCAGLIGGMLFGAVLAVVAGWPYRFAMPLRQWSDALSYSALVHGVMWTLHGAIAATLFAAVIVASRRVRASTIPGALGLAFLIAGATGFLVWYAAADAGVVAASELTRGWWAFLLGYWLVMTAACYTVIHLVARTRLAGGARRLGRIAFWPAAGLLAICLAIQWFERPSLASASPTWSPAPAAATQSPPDRPNVVLVVLDTQRADRLGCYGYPRPTTPRLDAFAKDAVVFENCVSPAIWTLPSHASMFTGLFPSEHGANWHHLWVDGKFPTAAEILKKAGYQTMGLTNNTFIGTLTNLSRGFDGFIQPWAIQWVRGNLLYDLLARALYPGHHIGTWLGVATHQDNGGKYTNQLVARFLEQRDPARPFFMFINYMEPHEPYRPPLPHRRVFIKPEEIENSYRLAWWYKRFQYSLLKRDDYTPAELDLLNRTYDAETRLQDDYVGELLQMLAARVPLDDTLIIVTADHGESLGDHHIIGHGWCVYETLTHVPLIVRYPRRLPPGRRTDLVQTVDVFPTMLDAASGRAVTSQSTFGRSLLSPPGEAPVAAMTTASSPSTAASGDLVGRVVVTERTAPQDPGLDEVQRIDTRFNRVPYEGKIRAVRQGPWKYIVWDDGREELYNLARDPGELTNEIDAHRPISQRLAEQLQGWLGKSKAFKDATPLKGQRRLDDESRRRLRALGYL